jgi:hypothetical protein
VTTDALPTDVRREILDPEAPLVFVDTAGIDAPERQPTTTLTSRTVRT